MAKFDIEKFRNEFKTKKGMKFKSVREKRIYLLGQLDLLEEYRKQLKGVD